jgi:hypothetical protein
MPCYCHYVYTCLLDRWLITCKWFQVVIPPPAGVLLQLQSLVVFIVSVKGAVCWALTDCALEFIDHCS